MADSPGKSSNPEFPFSQHEIESLVKTQQDLLPAKQPPATGRKLKTS
jgi:hypothetical protein